MPPNAADVLAGLDEEQAAAVVAPTGPVRILAGAGTGKTRAITHRIAHQSLTGQINPHTLLAVTHSTRAAGEMRERIRDLGVPAAQCRTFHAAALKQIAYFWSATGLPGTGPTLVASIRGGRYGMLRSALAATLNIHPSRVESTDVLDADSELTWARARMLTPEQYPAAARTHHRTRTLTPQALAAAFARYAQDKREAHLIDFEDVLDECATVLENNAAVADAIRSQYQHFVVDEYQDTDPAQQRLLNAWLGSRDSLTVVGDPSQCIYTFKGADPNLLTSFTDRYPGAVSVSLVRDYRSTPQVVQVANRLMEGHGQYVHLIGQQPPGRDPRVHTYDTEDAEAEALARRCADLIADGTDPGQIAVLYRFNSQSVSLAAALRNLGVRVTSGEDDAFFDRAEIRAVLTALATAAARDPDGDGATALTAALARAGHDPDRPPAGFGAARERFEAVAALAALAAGIAGPGVSVGQLISELHRRAAEDHAPAHTGAVTLSTIHMAKGLEWDVVLLPRWSEGSLPSTFAQTSAEFAEERRLAYVAITRARHRVEISHANRRSGQRSWRLEPSRFLAAAARTSRAGRDTATGPASRARRSGPSSGTPVSAAVGDRVNHDAYGLGRVLRSSPQSLVVDFGSQTRTVRTTDPKLAAL